MMPQRPRHLTANGDFDTIRPLKGGLTMGDRILMTGVTGLVGSSVAVALVRDGVDCEFVCLARGGLGSSAEARVASAIRSECEFGGVPDLADKVLSRISVVDCDVAELDADKLAGDPRVARVNKVFHCAADVNLGKDPTGRVFRINYEGTRRIVELAKRLAVQEFHFVATAYVAGRLKGVSYERTPSTEHGFNNPYEESKCKAELLVREAGLPFTIYRPAIIVGRAPDGRIRKPLAFYRILEFLQKLKSHKAAKTGVDPSGWMELSMNCATAPSSHIYFVPIDYVQAAIAHLFRLPARGETYHVTGSSPVSVWQIWDSTCGVMRIDGITVGDNAPRGTPEEKLFSKFIGDLFPYFSCEVIFDQANIRRDWPECEKWTYGAENLKEMVRSYLVDQFPNVAWVRKVVEKPQDRSPRT